MKTDTILIKLGGSILREQILCNSGLNSLCRDLKLLQECGKSVVLVHGGGPFIDEELVTLGVQWEFYEGQRVTTAEMMKVIQRVLWEKVNRTIVHLLNTSGVQAVGISGTDENLLLCRRVGGKLGNVGQIETVNPSPISRVLNLQSIPVIAPVGIDSDGNLLNVNADWAANWIAQSLGTKKMIYLTDQDGILDVRGDSISEVDVSDLKGLIQGRGVTGGMLTKVRTILDAIEKGVTEVHVLNASNPGLGTRCFASLSPGGLGC